MRPDASIHRLADRELKDAATFYERHRSDLGDSFLDDYHATLRRALEFPEAAPLLGSGVRRLLFSKFPYAIFYRVRPTRLRIVAIGHLRRRPFYWLGRR